MDVSGIDPTSLYHKPLNRDPLNAPAAMELSQWERAALTAWGRYISKAEERVLLDAVSQFASPGLILDNGCGEGRWTSLVRNHGWSAICTDVDPVALEKCRNRNPGVTCVLLSKEERSLPADDASVNLILSIEVPAVLESDWFQAEARRVLKPGGVIVGIFHNQFSFRGLHRTIVDRIRGVYCFYRMSFGKWRREIYRTAGLKVVHAEGLCWFPFGRTSNSRLIPFFTRLEQVIGLRTLPRLSPWVLFVARKQRD